MKIDLRPKEVLTEDDIRAVVHAVKTHECIKCGATMYWWQDGRCVNDRCERAYKAT